MTDLSEVSKHLMSKLQGVEYIIIEALGRKLHYSHINLDQAVEMASELKVKKAWFTHCSHHIGKAAEVNAELPTNMMLAYDGLSFEV